MPRSALTDTIGSMDASALAKDYPHLAAKIALKTGKAAGMDMKKPGSALTALHSDSFKSAFDDEMQSTPEYRRESRTLDRIMEPENVATYVPGETTEQSFSRGYQATADAVTRTGKGRGILFGRVLEETDRLGKLADFNETAYKKKRISEMRPTEDIDREILDLRNRALFSKAAMFENLNGLPYGAQTRAVAAMQKVFIDQINDLQTLREARVKDADNKVQEEIDAHTTRVSASEKRLDGLSRAIDILKEQGADEKDLAGLIIDRAKAMEALRKERQKGNGTGMTDTIDVIANALTQKYIQEHAGEEPNATAQQEIKRQAEFIVKNRGDITGAVLKAGGNLSGLRTQDRTVEETVPRNWFMRMLPDALVSPTTTRTRTIPGTDVLEEGGFGVPYSAYDEAELKRKRDLAGIGE